MNLIGQEIYYVISPDIQCLQFNSNSLLFAVFVESCNNFQRLLKSLAFIRWYNMLHLIIHTIFSHSIALSGQWNTIIIMNEKTYPSKDMGRLVYYDFLMMSVLVRRFFVLSIFPPRLDHRSDSWCRTGCIFYRLPLPDICWQEYFLLLGWRQSEWTDCPNPRFRVSVLF